MKNLLPILTFCTSAAFMNAQTVTPTVISNDGGYSSTSQGSIAWTIGEPVGDTYTASSNMTTMGFHQPEMELVNMINEQTDDNAILVYPNPVKEDLQIDFSEIQKGDYKLDIVDAIGKLIHASDARITDNSTHVRIKINEVAAGTYFLVIKGKEFNKTVKINKVN